MSTLKPNTHEWGKPLYPLTANALVNENVSAILNEAQHLFDWHADGSWKSEYKEGFAILLAAELTSRPSLIRKIRKLDNRVFSMMLFRAIELQSAVVPPN